MAKLDRLGWADGISFVSYGLPIGIRVNRPELLERLLPLLPPGWKAGRSPIVDYLFSLRVGDSSPSAHRRNFSLLYGGPVRLVRAMDVDELLDPLEHNLQVLVAEAARRRVFVHAGVVGWRGQAIVFPGRSFTGKSTLIAALVRAGATYYSDEYAVFDAKGRVHPYPRLLSIRDGDGRPPRRCAPEDLGGRSGSRPLPVGLVAITNYRPGARWRPREVSSGQAALALLDNTVPARKKPADVLDTVQQVVSQAPALKGARGEAEETVEAIFRQLEV